MLQASPAPPPARRWLLMVHHLPSQPSNGRVRTWRQLQQLGALSVKQAVYVLPDSTAARGGFQALARDIKDAGGDASVFASYSVDASNDEALVARFRRSRERAYAALARDLERALRPRRGGRRRGDGRSPRAPRLLEQFRSRVEAAERIDFFSAPGRERVLRLLEQLKARASADDRRTDGPASAGTGQDAFRDRLWVTRPRPGVDRLASAWLIRRFIDPAARFAFVIDRFAATDNALPFDMSEVEFSHHGDHCTFETLCDRFGVRDAAVARMAAIVHDLDLKDDRFGAPEAATIGAVIQGLQLAHADDDALLEQGLALFEALYRSLAHAPRTGGVSLRRKEP